MSRAAVHVTMQFPPRSRRRGQSSIVPVAESIRVEAALITTWRYKACTTIPMVVSKKCYVPDRPLTAPESRVVLSFCSGRGEFGVVKGRIGGAYRADGGGQRADGGGKRADVVIGRMGVVSGRMGVVSGRMGVVSGLTGVCLNHAVTGRTNSTA
ncbi:hypothetical protein BaRGS_00033286 [Batillaria attramentaria]|uniref:Uncharacterized protein n=1 Tax=Batillaria attramentaria TaxID=370345 RepID=A0ABD0JKL9_9CAEN